MAIRASIRLVFFTKLFVALTVASCFCTTTYMVIIMTWNQDRLPCYENRHENLTTELLTVVGYLSKEAEERSTPTKSLERLDALLKNYFKQDHRSDGVDPQRDVCPEAVVTDNGPFFQNPFRLSECEYGRPIGQLVTVVINGVDRTKGIVSLVRNIRRFYPSVPIVLATTAMARYEEDLQKYDVNTVKFYWNKTPGRILNYVVKNHVGTKYVLIARDLYDFNRFSSLERSVSVMSNVKGADVVGGAYRNETDHWRVGCYQMKAKNYFLDFTDGYVCSTGDCMVCDHLSSSFVTTKEAITKNPFDEYLPKSTLYQSWFLNLQIDEKLALNCPDVMYFQSTTDALEIPSDKSTFLPLARQWTFDHVRVPDHKIFKYGCSEIKYVCDLDSSTYYTIPKCCKDAIGQSLQTWNDFCKRHNISYELDTGTSLGSVKAGGLLYFDRDVDMLFLQSEYHLLEENYNELQRIGLHPTAYLFWNSDYCSFKEHGFAFELWGEGSTSASEHLPVELSAWPTEVYFDGPYLHGVANPGLDGRNRYGDNDLRHSQSWTVLKLDDSFVKYRPGKFVRCENPRHHSCLDKFPADGNIPFTLDLH